MRKVYLALGVAGLGLAFSTPAVHAATNFTNTQLTAPLPAQNSSIGDWLLEDGGNGVIGNGSSNRVGGAADPQNSSDNTVWAIGNDSSIKGHYIDFNYKASAPDVSGLSGSAIATFESIFKARNFNNGTGRGSPILSLTLGNNQDASHGVGVSINIVNEQPADDYHYILTEFSSDSSFAPLLDLGQFALGSTSDHQDANFEHAVLSLDNTGKITLVWNGVTVYNQVPAGGALGSVDARAIAGSGSAVQPYPSNAYGVVFFQKADLSASSTVPEPTGLALAGLGLLALRRRRA
jgi:MYXO-CTERM domain-containing protein